MQQDTSADAISRGPAPGESKGESDANAVTLEHLEDEPAPHLHIKTFLIVAAVSFISFAQLIQLVATGVFATTVAEAVGGASQSSWMLSSLTIAFVVFAPPVSQAADYWGRRWLLIILTMLGCVGTIITSRATSMGMAITGEVFVGAAFSATPLQFAVASEVLPRKQRLAGQAGINAAGGTGSIFALLAGAKFVDVYGIQGFRYLYYINLTSETAGIFAMAALVCFLLYRPPVLELQTALTNRQKLARLDWPGYAITMGAVVLFSIGLSWALNPYPWSDPHVLAPFILGVALFVVLVVYCWKLRKNSFIPHALFSRDRNAALSLFAIWLEGFIFAAANIYVPTQTAVLYATTSMDVSLVFTIALVCYVVLSPVTAVICYKFKSLRTLIIVGFVFFLAWAICMATTTLGSSSAVRGYQALLGAALAFVLNAVVASAQLSAPPELISITSGLVAGIRSLGVTLGVAIYTAIFHSRITNLLPAKVTEAALQNGLPDSSVLEFIMALMAQNPDLLAAVPGITPEIIAAGTQALREAYLGSFRSVWIATSCFSAVSIIVSCFLVNPAKDLNNHIDNPAETDEALYGESKVQPTAEATHVAEEGATEEGEEELGEPGNLKLGGSNPGGTSGGTSNRIESSESESTPIDTVHFGIFHDQVQTEVQKLQSSVSAINGAVGELSKTFSKYGNIVTTVGERYEKDQELEEKIQELEVSNNRIWKNILQDRAKYDKDMANQEREYEAKLSTLQAQADAGEQEKRKYVEMERQLEEQHNKAKQKMSRDLQRKTIQLESENAERITNLEKEITELQSDKARVRQELVQRIQERDGEKELRETMQTKLRADVKALEKALTDIKAKYEVEQQPSQFYEGRYKGVIDQVGHIATSYFTELSEKAIDDPVGTSNRLRRKGYNFAKIPIMISECSRVLRLAYVQHIIFGVLCGSMWQPMFSPYLWVHKKDKMSVLQEIYSGLAAEGEDVQHNWKVSTLKILDQRDEEVDVGMLMDELIDQVVSATEPLLDRDQLDPFRDDLKVVFADGMELARTAQQDRFPVCVETTPSVNDRTGWKEYSNEEFDVVDELPRSPTSDVHGESLFVQYNYKWDDGFKDFIRLAGRAV
ncbi:hypothetical protein B0A52_01198 [Exophiala mesophila]|uniref:Major facilitator superfamily (MFS) profile domain-containing protein n=1 Tax=Exophiala mesophila TaxID=212818 RepID=A0A438NGR7_EXOME|nr:hypothetical protein B0A52_01198 [Exophiala mesophila]